MNCIDIRGLPINHCRHQQCQTSSGLGINTNKTKPHINHDLDFDISEFECINCNHIVFRYMYSQSCSVSTHSRYNVPTDDKTLIQYELQLDSSFPKEPTYMSRTLQTHHLKLEHELFHHVLNGFGKKSVLESNDGYLYFIPSIQRGVAGC